MAVSREETLNQIINIVADKLNISRDTISATSSFKDLGADSLDIVELIMTFEEAFNIEINDDQAESIATINDATDHVYRLICGG
jgi:acyl carrier protein